MQKNNDRSTNEIKCSIGVDGARQDVGSTISNGKLKFSSELNVFLVEPNKCIPSIVRLLKVHYC